MYQYMEAIFELRNPKQYRELKAALEECFGEEESYYEWIAAIHSCWGAGQAIAQSGGEYGGERLTERSHEGTRRRLALTHSGERDLERNSGAPRRLVDSEHPLQPRRRLDGSSRLGITPSGSMNTPRRSSNVFGVEGEGAYVDWNRLSIPSGAYRLTWGEKVLNFFVSPVYADEGVHGQTFLFDEESARHFIPFHKRFYVTSCQNAGFR